MTHSLDHWQAEKLRLTTFTSPQTVEAQSSWWERVIGQVPDNKSLQPKKAVTVEKGTYEGGELTLSIQPVRIDWYYNPIPNEQTFEYPTLGRYPDTLGVFKKPMDTWLELDIPVTRLAFGAAILLLVQNREEGYKQLQDYLPMVKIDPSGSSDFFYQINRTRKSRSAGFDLKINRLSKWSVLDMRMTQFTVGPDQQVQQLSAEQQFAIRLELDINTSQEFKDVLPQAEKTNMFNELIALGEEIILKGDIQ